MRKYCSLCGKKSTLKSYGDKGEIPYCNSCDKYFFDEPKCAVIVTLIYHGNIIVAKHNNSERYVMFTGYLKEKETLEQCVIREIKEKTNLEVIESIYLESYYYAKNEVLVIGFKASVVGEIILSNEIEDISILSYEEAMKIVPINSIAYQNLKNSFK